MNKIKEFIKKFIENNFEDVLAFLIFGLIAILIIALNVFGCGDMLKEDTTTLTTTAETTTTEIVTETTTADVEEATQNTVAQPMTEETTTKPQVKYYNVPLDEQFQRYVFAECEKRNVSPALIFAIMERESNFRAECVGDSGNSLGIMQIQPKWHQWRADELGCLDWMNPYDNATVGIDIIADYFEKYGDDVYYVLMIYNGGLGYANRMVNKGAISNYAKSVVARAEELDKEIEVR